MIEFIVDEGPKIGAGTPILQQVALRFVEQVAEVEVQTMEVMRGVIDSYVPTCLDDPINRYFEQVVTGEVLENPIFEAVVEAQENSVSLSTNALIQYLKDRDTQAMTQVVEGTTTQQDQQQAFPDEWGAGQGEAEPVIQTGSNAIAVELAVVEALRVQIEDLDGDLAEGVFT